MPINPMQRRARNSFLTGMLVTLVVMLVVVAALFHKISQLNEDMEKLIAEQQTVYVTAEEIHSGGEVTMELLVEDVVKTSMDLTNALTMDDFTAMDEEGNSWEIEYISKVNIPAGTIITKDMISEMDEKVTNDQRIQEYNMIVLPSQLQEGDYIDIRFKLANGNDYVVIPKKKVLKCTAETIWLKLYEHERLTLGNAIIEAYQAQGSKLYASIYTDAGLQEAAVQTYVVNTNVYGLIANNPNVLDEAKNALWARYNDQTQVQQRTEHIEPAIQHDAGTVESGVQSEISTMKTYREAFIQELEGGS